jgi:hypothetical protein
MTVLRLLQVSRRAWYVVIGGLILSSLAVGWVHSQAGVYYGQVDVVFLRPVNRAVPNGLSVSSSSVIATAGVVERTVNARGSGTRVVSEQVTLVGMGVRHGELIRLPNSGGQWANNFDRAVLDVEVVDTTAPRAQARLQSAVTRIIQTLDRLQSDAAVPEDLRIRPQLSPFTPQVSYQTGNTKRAGAMTLLLGLALTWTALVLLEARRRRPSHSGGAEAKRARLDGLDVVPAVGEPQLSAVGR